MKSPVYLKALRAFEASARHHSFSAAAAELNVTPAAVGQLVRSLESWLGLPLFHRASGGRVRLIPTEAAERALPDIRAGLERLGLSRLRAGPTADVLTVTMSPAFAAKWLLPRIEHFHARHPEMDVRLDTNIRLTDFKVQNIDAGLRYSRGDWPGLVVEKLMDEQIYPVCSPDWLSRNGPLHEPNDLSGKALIHDLSVDTNIGFASWVAWLQRAGAMRMEPSRGMQVNNSAAVLQAAIDGHGAALARSVMARDDVKAGRLVRLFPQITLASELAYYMAYPTENASSRKLQVFREWLMQETAGFH